MVCGTIGGEAYVLPQEMSAEQAVSTQTQWNARDDRADCVEQLSDIGQAYEALGGSGTVRKDGR